jgi:hypothetical protein
MPIPRHGGSHAPTPVTSDDPGNRKLKPLLPDPFGHQHSAIARSEPCQALTISARRYSPTRLQITAFDPKQESDLRPLCARIGHFDLLRRPCHGRLTANADTLRVKYRGEVDLELRFSRGPEFNIDIPDRSAKLARR